LGLKAFILFISLVVSSTSWSQTDFKTKSDSLSFYLSKSQDDETPSRLKLSYAEKAKNMALEMGMDSLVIQSNLNLSDIYLNAGFNEDFLKVTHNNLKFSEKVEDTLSTALISKSLGDYYDRHLTDTDSAFFYYNKSKKLYWALHDTFNTAVLLLDIAIIQKNEKDFTGSEISSVEGISLLETLKTTNEVLRKKAYHYNNLGLVFDQLEQYDEAIKYHKRTLELMRELRGNNQAILDVSKNNLALAYKNSKQYDTALDIYESILSQDDLVKERPEFYTLALDNYAHTLYLSKQHEKLPQLYLKALGVIDSVNPIGYTSISINQHLAEYYNEYKIKDSAKYYAYKAKEISEQYHNDDLLKSLLLLSRIEEDSIAVKYYDTYIKLDDSLQKNERKVRNKFERIRFETKQIEDENAQIEREKLWLMLLSGILLITALLIYIIVTQRNKNKELQLIQQQQEANEEIYNLMLSQQDKIEEARIIEKKRVSQELHDGVLGRLFGTRLSLDSLNVSSSAEAIKTRGQYIDELKTIEQDIRKVSHELNTDFISGSGFMDIVKTLVETQTEVYNINHKLNCDDSIHWDDVSNKTKIHVYRIVQESLHNIYKHANASLVQISFELKNNVIWLTIIDDGVGFDVDKAKKGIGIKNIHSRINEIEGILNIKSEKGKGTTIIITIPT
tara:strand:- start:18158 stop:20179 length:2022 start_codon:yes stop_codon:yes gene_type:complete